MVTNRRALSTIVLLGLCLLAGWPSLASSPGSPSAPTPSSAPSWVEPRALNIVDMAGQVSDDVLAGHVVCYGNPGGLVTYQSARWQGGKLRVTVTVYPRFHYESAQFGWVSKVSTLAHKPVFDRPSSSMPASHVRLYDGARDVTEDVLYIAHMDPALGQPVDSAGDPRYDNAWSYDSVVRPFPADGVPLPANWAGFLTVRNTYHALTAVFTIANTPRPTVQYLGQESLEYPSYVGPGWVGWFESLMDQMRAIYPDRHPRLFLNVPQGANYVLLCYDPLPYDIEAGHWNGDRDLYERNRNQPTGGTVRLAPDASMLSQDLTHAGAFPLAAWWQDADQSAGPYLSYFTAPIDRITPPEWPLVHGTPYSNCYVDGGCSSSVLQDVYDRRATIRVVYLKVTPPTSGVEAIPLRFADTNWSSGMSGAQLKGAAVTSAWPAAIGLGSNRIYIPYIARPPAPIPLPNERPAGYFVPESGRMVGYVAQ